MNEKLKNLLDTKDEEFQIVADERLQGLRRMDALERFSSVDHYKVSIIHLLKNYGGKLALRRIQMVHPNGATLNDARKALEESDKLIHSVKEGQAVYIELVNKPATTATEGTTSTTE